MSATFLDGPAQGVVLDLRRAPFMLRVVKNHKTGEWDALDQPDDVVKPTEQVFVYRSTAAPSHIKCQKRSESGFYESTSYQLLAEQPKEETIRTNQGWRAWCDANREALVAGTWAEKVGWR
jgi:hypothetical protein